MNHQRLVQTMVCLGLVTLPLVGCAGAQTAATGTPSGDGDKVSQLVQKITWLRSTNPYGHTGIKVQTDARVIYLDPVDLVDIEGLPKADIILITHEHADHFSPQTIAALSKESTQVVSIEGVTRSLGDANGFALAPGETVSVDGLEVETVPAYNASHAQALGYVGFVFSIDGVRVYCSGDTGLHPEMESLSGIDIAVLNVRKPYCLSGEEVVKFAEIVKPTIIIPIHWMPEDNTYGDEEEIEHIRQNMPDTTLLTVLELMPQSE